MTVTHPSIGRARRTALVAIALPLLASGCMRHEVPRERSGFVTMPATERHAVRLAAGQRVPDAAERARLFAFLDAAHPSPEARALVTGGQEPSRRRAVADLIASVYGLPVDVGTGDDADAVTVTLQDRRIDALACERDETSPPGTLPPGCANAANLAAMVERSSDLHRGRALGPALAGPIGVAADRYLTGQMAELPDQLEDE